MGTLTTDQHYAGVTVSFFAADGVTPEPVNGVPVWATSDATLITVVPMQAQREMKR